MFHYNNLSLNANNEVNAHAATYAESMWVVTIQLCTVYVCHLHAF